MAGKPAGGPRRCRSTSDNDESLIGHPGTRGGVVMRTCAILPTVTDGLWLAAEYGAERPTHDRVEQVVVQIGSPVYRERVAASRALDALGDAALDLLRRAAQSSDAETRRRAGELLEKIELRATTARLLAPATVEIDIHQLS